MLQWLTGIWSRKNTTMALPNWPYLQLLLNMPERYDIKGIIISITEFLITIGSLHAYL